MSTTLTSGVTVDSVCTLMTLGITLLLWVLSVALTLLKMGGPFRSKKSQEFKCVLSNPLRAHVWGCLCKTLFCLGGKINSGFEFIFGLWILLLNVWAWNVCLSPLFDTRFDQWPTYIHKQFYVRPPDFVFYLGLDTSGYSTNRIQ